MARTERERIDYRTTFLRRRALPTTETEMNIIAALAIIGLSSNPKNRIEQARDRPPRAGSTVMPQTGSITPLVAGAS